MRPLHWFALALLLVLAPCPARADRWPGQLEAGEFAWLPAQAPDGPLLLVAGLADRRAYLYRNGVRVAEARFEGGAPGATAVLRKHQEQVTGIDGDERAAPAQRLRWTGPSFRAPAADPAPPVLLPAAFARRLFDANGRGMAVVVASDFAEVPRRVHPGWLAATVPGLAGRAGLAPGEAWDPQRAPRGPMTLVVDAGAGSLLVLREGVEIGRAPLRQDGGAPRGTRVLQLQSGYVGADDYATGGAHLRWLEVPLHGGDAAPAPVSDGLLARVEVSPALARAVYDALVPGSTVVMADSPLQASGPDAVALEAAGETDAGDAATRTHQPSAAAARP